ncbi:hypothetical protein L6R52_36665, partial [Myxococcota bacterium]|nr:hypothetical protein [Myxococcota bacterium]
EARDVHIGARAVPASTPDDRSASGAPRAEPLDPPVARPVIGARAAKVGAEKDPPPARSLPEVRYDSADAGDFYCEHVYFTANEVARAPSSSVVSNASGEPLVGFIHIPEDAAATRPPPRTTTASELAARHGRTREVVGAAIAGYVHDVAAARTEGPINVLITGFGTFGSYTNNPSGEFVSNRANLDAAMESAFGARLVGRPPPGADLGQPLTYRVQMEDGSTREVRVRALALPVSDDALDPARPGSLPHEMATFQPHAVISMGLRPGTQTHYDVESRADAGGLRRDGARRVHDDAARRPDEGYRNRSLERAIEWARTHPVP